MRLNHLCLLVFGIIVACGSTLAEAATTSETRTIGEDVNAIFLWAVDPDDVTFAAGASDFSALAGWRLDTNPTGNPGEDDHAWVLSAPGAAAGGSVVGAGTTAVDLGFDYVPGGLFGVSTFQYQFALVLFDGTRASVRSSGARTLVRSALVNAGIRFGPALTAAQFNAIDDYFATMPSGAAVPLPGCLALLSSAVAFAGLWRRRQGMA